MKTNPIKRLWDRSWFSSLYLLLLVGGAAGGILSGLSPTVMIAAAALALISWELLEQAVRQRENNVLPSVNGVKLPHFTILMISVGSGLLLAEGGLLVHLSLPFGIVALAGLLILYSFSRFYRLSIR